jgi:hypothetical protein
LYDTDVFGEEEVGTHYIVLAHDDAGGADFIA